jgi:hypothetical protein
MTTQRVIVISLLTQITFSVVVGVIAAIVTSRQTTP